MGTKKNTSKRGLKEESMIVYRSGGMLEPLVERVRVDDTLCFEIRDDYVNIYYRGGKLLCIKRNGGKFFADLDKGYLKKVKSSPVQFPFIISNQNNADSLVDAISRLKEAMDEFFSTNLKGEREFQQLVVRENNRSPVSGTTDYLICDLEYTHTEHRYLKADMIAAFWPSQSKSRKYPGLGKLELSIIEMKYGDGALTGDGKRSGGAGIEKHFNDLTSISKHLKLLREEMTTVLKQKAELGLIRQSKIDEDGRWKKLAFVEAANGKTDWILLLANHDPESEILRRELEKLSKRLAQLTDFPFNVKVATANFMGYGLYKECILPLDEFLNSRKKQIYSE